MARVSAPGWLVGRLVEADVLHPDVVADREVVLVDASRSNPVHLVMIDGVALVVVKQAGPAVDGLDPVTAEDHAYRWLNRALGAGTVAPRRIGAAAEGGMLVVEAVPHSRPLHELLAAADPAAGSAMADLGRRLAAVHRALEPTTGVPARPAPWVARLPHGLPPEVSASDRVRAVVDEIATDPALAEAARWLRADWCDPIAHHGLIHGDVKFDNVLVQAGAAGPRTWLVDWELAGAGPAVWDLAGVVDGVLAHQLATDGRVDPARAAPLIRAALAAYRAEVGPAAVDPDRLLAAVALRQAQTAVQAEAMTAASGDHPVLVDSPRAALTERALGTARALADRPDRWRWVVSAWVGS